MQKRINKQKLESKLRQEERKKCFEGLIYEMEEFIKEAESRESTNEDEPKNVDEFYSTDSFSDSGESVMTLKPEQLNEVNQRKLSNRAVELKETDLKAETPDYTNDMPNSGDGPQQLNDLNSKKGLAANKARKPTSKSSKKTQTPNTTPPKPGAKICFKSNLPQSQPVSLKVTERPIWRI
ncbi:hypothetical protein ACLKA7_015484 [Drosophila subpalustris]